MPPAAAPQATTGRFHEGAGSWFWWALLGLLALSLARIHVSSALPLFGDEAFYWLEGRYLAWAYSDLPPLTAWLTRAGSELFGMSYLGVRGLSLLCWLAVPVLVTALARTGGASAPAALVAGCLSCALPVHGLVAPFALPEAPLNLVWLLSAWLASRIVTGANRPGWWLCLGLCLALGVLTHYRIAPLLLGMAGLFLLHREARSRLRSPWPWLAAMLPLAALWPQWDFNRTQDFAALSFQLVERHPWAPQLAGLKLPLIDLLLLTPVLGWLLLSATARQWGARSGGFAAVLLWLGAFPIVFYWLASPLVDTERVSFHWSLAGWLTLCAGLPAVLEPLFRRGRPGVSVAVILLAVVPGLALSSGMLSYWRSAAQRTDQRPVSADVLPDNLIGWPQFAERLGELRRDRGVRRLLADNFMLAAELTYELGEPIESLDHPLNHKHGRAVQLAIWGLDHREPISEPALVAVEVTALDLVERTRWVKALCEQLGSARIVDEIVLFGGRKRVLVWQTTPGVEAAMASSAGCDQPAFWYIDAPTPDSRHIGVVQVQGWALETSQGVRAVDLLLDGERVSTTEFGLPRPGVGEFFDATDAPDHPLTGFTGTIAITPENAGRRQLQLQIHERDGGVRVSDPRWLELATR
ncbi:MAG: glycosyltransferase family 39 protein [Pseudomonadota bacterium]